MNLSVYNKPTTRFLKGLTEIESRKRDHIKISLEHDVTFRNKTNWFEYVELIHTATPDLDLDNISTEVTFLSRKFSAPFLIEGMTGGTSEAERINGNIAEAAALFGIPAGVGSQRAAVKNPELVRTFKIARDRAPDAFLIANIGAVQLVEDGIDIALKAIDMIEADAIAIHLNPLQEVVQPDGRAFFKGFYKTLRKLKLEISIPVIVKEVGCGISGPVSSSLEDSGVDAVDVAGSGGTNWTLIEKIRAESSGAEEKVSLAEVFIDWGIPTAAAVLEARAFTSLPIVASGGIRTGLEAAKALALGCDAVGFAHPILVEAVKSSDAVLSKLKQLRRDLVTAMFLTSCENVEKLRQSEFVLLGPLLDWAKQRCLKHPKLKDRQL